MSSWGTGVAKALRLQHTGPVWGAHGARLSCGRVTDRERGSHPLGEVELDRE